MFKGLALHTWTLDTTPLADVLPTCLELAGGEGATIALGNDGPHFGGNGPGEQVAEARLRLAPEVDAIAGVCRWESEPRRAHQ